MQFIELELPSLQYNNKLGQDVALRPQRKGGPRYDYEKIDNKYIFHNYGHGGYGVTILYGMVNHVLQNFYQKNLQCKNIAVLGSGYYGLLTALLLQKKGYQVTLYSKHYPIQPLDFKNTKITSQVAGGLFFPYFDKDEFYELGKKFCYQTWLYYKERINNKKNKGLYQIQIYYLNMNPIKEYGQNIPNEILKFKKIQVRFNKSSKILNGYKTNSIQIDGDMFLNELLNECKEEGVIFQQQTFNNKIDMLNLKQNIIFNCLGFNAMKIIYDNRFELGKGHLIYFQKTKGFNYYLKYKFKNNDELTLYPQYHKTAVGLTKIKEEIKDQKNEDKYFNIINQRIKKFLNEIEIQPKL